MLLSFVDGSAASCCNAVRRVRCMRCVRLHVRVHGGRRSTQHGGTARPGRLTLVRCAAHVPELAKEDGALVLDCPCHRLPRLCLLRGVDARGAGIPKALGGHDRGLADHQAALGTALGVVLGSLGLGQVVKGPGKGRGQGKGACRSHELCDGLRQAWRHRRCRLDWGRAGAGR